jgi:N12 class adenine-specific DNA methylase
VEVPENIGKIISIDIETGDYELADDFLAGAMRLQAKHPDAAIYGIRIGYNAVVAFGGTLRRIVP